MNQLKRLLVNATAFVPLFFGSQASATTFQFTYTGTGGLDNISGQITATPSSGDSYLATGISGNRDGQNITGLLAPGSLGFQNDNLLFPNSDPLIGPPGLFLDFGGIAFSTVAGHDWHVFGHQGTTVTFSGNTVVTSTTYAEFPFGGTLINTGTFSLVIIPDTNPVPEPVTLSVFLAGLASAVGLRRRKKNVA